MAVRTYAMAQSLQRGRNNAINYNYCKIVYICWRKIFAFSCKKKLYFNSNQLQLKNNMNNTHLLRGIYLLGFIFIFACPWNQRNLEPNKYWWIHNTQGWSAIASDYQGERTLAVKNTCKFIVKRQERLFIPGSQLEVCKLTLH